MNLPDTTLEEDIVLLKLKYGYEYCEPYVYLTPCVDLMRAFEDRYNVYFTCFDDKRDFKSAIYVIPHNLPKLIKELIEYDRSTI